MSNQPLSDKTVAWLKTTSEKHANGDPRAQAIVDLASEVQASRDRLAASEKEVERLKAALTKIDEIRNSIVGYQSINWSAHIYPLVEALEEAGYEGLGHEKASELARTQLQRIAALEQRVSELTAEVQARNSTVDAQAVQLGKLRADLAECEGLLRQAQRFAVSPEEIKAYFERRKQ